MSSFLAIGAVTALLKNLLEEGLIRRELSDKLGGDLGVDALAPDLIQEVAKTKTRLNLFLYQATPNSGWRNVGLPSHNGQGERTSAPALALDLHYLLTAYSKDTFGAEILLGYAMQLLHETPVLTRQTIRQKQQEWSSDNNSLLAPWPPPTSPSRPSRSRSARNPWTLKRYRGCGWGSRRTSGRPWPTR